MTDTGTCVITAPRCMLAAARSPRVFDHTRQTTARANCFLRAHHSICGSCRLRFDPKDAGSRVSTAAASAGPSILRALPGMSDTESSTPSREEQFLIAATKCDELVPERMLGEPATLEIRIGDQVIVEKAPNPGVRAPARMNGVKKYRAA